VEVSMRRKKVPKEEIRRLALRLVPHLREMRIEMNKDERLRFTKSVLEKQGYTCAFAGRNGRYCWNAPKDENLGYLKLEWAHKIPRSRMSGSKSHKLYNLYLLCSRCNNQLQTSRTIHELSRELEHKLKVIKSLALEGTNQVRQVRRAVLGNKTQLVKLSNFAA
jgi:5-methylcytosine-specific restriction endonuclease McrA